MSQWVRQRDTDKTKQGKAGQGSSIHIYKTTADSTCPPKQKLGIRAGLVPRSWFPRAAACACACDSDRGTYTKLEWNWIPIWQQEESKRGAVGQHTIIQDTAGHVHTTYRSHSDRDIPSLRHIVVILLTLLSQFPALALTDLKTVITRIRMQQNRMQHKPFSFVFLALINAECSFSISDRSTNYKLITELNVVIFIYYSN
jgi:hypothetical protein